MAIFNPQFFTNPVASLNTAFGIPTCILNLGVQALSLVSSDVLQTLASTANDGKAAARSAIAGVVRDLFGETGLLQYDDGSGKLTLLSSSSNFGLDLGFMQTLANVTGFLSEIESVANQGIGIYNELANCMRELEDFLNSTGPAPMTGVGGVGGGSTDQYTQAYREAALGIARQEVESATNFINQCDELILNVGTVLRERQLSDTESTSDEPIFRLVYGPPVSKRGVFILSEDGLYFDSQNRLYNGKPIPSASDIGFVVDSDKWKMDHAPNLGGKGTLVSVETLNTYVDTMFDINVVDNSQNLIEFYKEDLFLNTIEGQKDKLVYDLSAQVGDLINSGYTQESAIVINLLNSINSTISNFNTKVDKRKKQIEVAVKGPDLFGSDEVFSPGNIPVNDFSFLSSISLDVALETQELLIFGAGEVDDVVLPMSPVFAESYGRSSNVLLDPLVIPPIGKGSIVFNHSPSSTDVPAISLTDNIVTTSLFGIYNFLQPDGVAPDSNQFQTKNAASLITLNSAQMIGSAPTLFTSGLGIPRFDGLARVAGPTYALNNSPGCLRLPPSKDMQDMFYGVSGCSIDCWLTIPQYGASANTKEVNGSGVPNLYPNHGEWADYNYYKILLGNENTGGSLGIADVSSLVDSKGSNTTRGLLIGFTRDPVIESDGIIIPGTNTNPGLNAGIDTSATTASSCFFIAPTLSMNASSVEFIPSNEDCTNFGFRKLVVKDTFEVSGYDDAIDTSTPKSFKDVSGSFIHLHMSFDVGGNKCSIYLDGNLMATSSMEGLFGSPLSQPPRLPTLITGENSINPSFYYSNSTVNQRPGINMFNNGPKTDQYFTPWIVGSGWTDGLPITVPTTMGAHPVVMPGGFMGDRHGISSGLNGHVGSLKFYARPLTIKEVRQNYEAQKGFFKNIYT